MAQLRKLKGARTTVNMGRNKALSILHNSLFFVFISVKSRCPTEAVRDNIKNATISKCVLNGPSEKIKRCSKYCKCG